MVMREMGLEFEQMSPDVDEKAIRHSSPQVLTLALARAKNLALRERIKEPAILITSDQVVTCQGVIREKPVDAQEAREFLRSYREHPAVCVTAVMVYNNWTRYDAAVLDEATVWFKDLTDEAIERVIADGHIFTSAGGFSTGHPSFDPHIDRIKGERESVIGLPRKLTERLILDALNS